MRGLRIYAVATVVVACFTCALARASLIDSFSATENNDPDSVAIVNAATSDSQNFTISPTVTDPIGSRRQLSVQQNAQNQSTSLTIDGGVATITSTPTAASSWTITYGVGFPFVDYDATDGGTADAFKLTFDSSSGGLEVSLGATSQNGGGSSNNGFYQPVSGNSILVPFALFTGQPNLDFTHLFQMQIRLRDGGLTSGGNAVLTQFETVPEPASGALADIAVLTLACVARRKR